MTTTATMTPKIFNLPEIERPLPAAAPCSAAGAVACFDMLSLWVKGNSAGGTQDRCGLLGIDCRGQLGGWQRWGSLGFGGLNAGSFAGLGKPVHHLIQHEHFDARILGPCQRVDASRNRFVLGRHAQ